MPAVANPRALRTRRLLIEAAHRLIAENGVAGLRIADITGQAGVALGSFQNHFASKDELVEAVVSEAIQRLTAEVVDQPVPGDDPAVVATAALRRIVRLAHDDPAFCRLLVNLSRGEELLLHAIRPYARAVLGSAVDAGAFAIDDIDVAVTSIVVGALAVTRGVLDGDLAPDADESLARMVLIGFGVPRAEAGRLASLPLVASELTPRP